MFLYWLIDFISAFKISEGLLTCLDQKQARRMPLTRKSFQQETSLLLTRVRNELMIAGNI